MNRVVAILEQRTTGNGEPARKRMSGALHAEWESGDANPADPMAETAEHLVRIATKAFMQMRNVDYETARRWIADAAAVPEERNNTPAPKSRKARN